MRTGKLFRFAVVVDAGDELIQLRCLEDNGIRGLFVHDQSDLAIKPTFVYYFSDLVECK